MVQHIWIKMTQIGLKFMSILGDKTFVNLLDQIIYLGQFVIKMLNWQ